MTQVLTEPRLAQRKGHPEYDFEQHRDMLLTYATVLTRDTTLAGDLVQQAFLRTFEAASKGREIKDPPKWLRGVLKNVWREYLREKKKMPVTVSDMFARAADNAAEASLFAAPNEKVSALKECLDKLDVKDRELIRMRYTENLACEKISLRVGRGVTWVRVRLHRLRKKLADCIQRKEH